MGFPKKARNPSVTGGRAMDIGILVARVLDENRIAEDMDFKLISERFPDVVGALVAPFVSFVKLDRRTLVLKAETSAWKQELYLQKNAIIARCNTVLGHARVSIVRII